MPNRMTQMVERLNRFSPALRYFLLSKSFGRVVPFFGTAGIRIEELSHSQVVMTLQNRHKVQNHIRTVHAAAMTLLAESATGILMGMNVPDDKYMVIKSLHVDFQKKASGAMKAVATLTPEQVRSAQNDAEGEILVSVSVSDASGNEPVACQMLWAWKPKRV
jgi:acyl-coenzyme A thioesterase PaaI-like protein